MSNKITKDFKFVSYFNFLFIILASLILLIPLIFYTQTFYSVGQVEFLQPGVNKVANLSVVITLIIVLSLLNVLLGWIWVKHLKIVTNENLSIKAFKWILITLGVNFLAIIFFAVAFFCIWLTPINGNISDTTKIINLNKIRYIIYIATYISLVFVFLIVSTSCVIWTNLRISYRLSNPTYEKK